MAHKAIVLTVLLSIILSACAQATPAASDIQTAISMTLSAQQANATATWTVIPTVPPTPTATVPPSPTPTNTPVPTDTPVPSPTPDLRVVAVSTKDLLCKKDILPGAPGDYILPAGWLSPHTNEEIIHDHVDTEHARKYIQETGRIEGWWVDYYRAKTSNLLPEYIYCQVIQFKTVEGANKALHWGLWDYKYDYQPVDIGKVIGQDSIVQSQDISGGGTELRRYLINFQYQNLNGNLQVTSPKKDANVEHVIALAEALLVQLKKIQLSDPSVLREK